MHRKQAIPNGIILLLTAALIPHYAAADQTASGKTTIGAEFEATQLPTDAAAPSRTGATAPSQKGAGQPKSVLFDSEYSMRKAALTSRAAVSTGPPRLEIVDLLNPGRAPVAAAQQSLAQSPSASFEGIQQTLFNPPDPDIAAGPTDLILVVNSSIARYTKTGLQTNISTLQQWFSSVSATTCPHGIEVCNFLDPSIRYDSLHGRFLLSAVAEDTFNHKTYFVLSVSNGATFDGGWKNWALEGSLNGTVQTIFEIDSPRLGYDNNAVYLTANMFNVTAHVLQYAKIRILKKSELYNPATTALTYQDIWDLRNEDSSKVSSLQPMQLRGQPGVGVPPGLLINTSELSGADYLSLWRIDNPLSATPTANRTTVRNVWPYSLPGLVPQKGSLFTLDPGDQRVLKAIVRNGVMYTARNTGYSTEPATVTFDRIDLAANKVTLQTRKLNGYFFFPAFDVPASQGPGNNLPDKLISGTTTDAAGAIAFPGITEVKEGEDSYEATAIWGKYSGGAVDPVQGGLWTYSQYAKPRSGASGRWGTWASYFPVTTGPQFNDVVSSNPFYDAINMIGLWSISNGCQTGLYCPGDNVTRAQMSAFIIRAIAGNNFTFPAQPSFTDVPASHPFFSYIQKMKELGITSGCTATTYCPENFVTRGEMAVFMVRGKLKSLLGDTFSFPSTAFFTDVPTTHLFYSYIQKMRELGITTGCTATTYCPEINVTRDQMAAFLARSFLN